MRFKTLGAASSLAIVACMAAPAHAQNEPESSTNSATAQTDTDQEEGRTNVITVTAQFRAQNLQDTPIAITAVNSEMLEARGQTNIAQVAAQAPNVSLTPQPQNGGTGLIAYIRGVGQTDFNYALDPGVGIYIDDVFIPTLSSSLLELMDLDRIEILRGPQGTLAGKNSIGGAIKLFSAKPTGDGSGSLMVTYGSFNRLEVRGMADMRVNDQLSFRASGIFKGRDGYLDLARLRCGAPERECSLEQRPRRLSDRRHARADSRSAAGRFALRWEPDATDRGQPLGRLHPRALRAAADGADRRRSAAERDQPGVHAQYRSRRRLRRSAAGRRPGPAAVAGRQGRHGDPDRLPFRPGRRLQLRCAELVRLWR
jgi:iron complex outermembrane receptor protein